MTTAAPDKPPKRVRRTRGKVARLNTRRMALTDLTPHERNEKVRKHPPEGSPKWEALRRSMEKDYFDPMVWNERNGKLVSGHLRRKILLADGYNEADVVVVSYTEQEHLARLLAANETMGEHIEEGMRDLWADFKGWQDDGEIEDPLGWAAFSFDDARAWGWGEQESETDGGTADTDDAHTPETYTEEELALLFSAAAAGEPDFVVHTGDVYVVGDNYFVCANLIKQHALYLPYLERLKEEYPDREVLFVPIPDPLMVGVTDSRVACLFVQPSALAAAWSLTLLRRRRPDHTIYQLETE